MPNHKGGHLHYGDRCDIARMLAENKPFTAIADALDVSASTISREVSRNRVHTGYGKRAYQMKCRNYPSCELTRLCKKKGCVYPCKSCKYHRCRPSSCEHFVELMCEKISASPYCCNGCAKKGSCGFRQYFYRAKEAQGKAEKRLSEPRSGIDLNPDKLLEIVKVVTNLASKGQSLAHIWRTHGAEFGMSERSFYRYIHSGYFNMTAFMLPKRPRYKPRKGSKKRPTPKDLTTRTYADFMALCEQKRLSVVQIDCIEGFKSESQAILTLHLVRFNFQIALLLPAQTKEWTTKAFDALEALCEGTFSTHFGLILADRGSEFIDYRRLERSRDGKKRCSVYYCDPGRADQKGSAEKNHVEIRKILPKRKTHFSLLTPSDMADINSHVNSYTRASLGGKAPLELAAQILPESLLEGLGIRLIAPDDVCLTPNLLRLSER